MAEPTDKNKFSWAYLITGNGWKDWWKAWGAAVKITITVIGIALLILGIVSLWRMFFPKPSQNISKQKFTVQSGGHLDNITIQTTVRDKPKARVFLYGDVSGGSATGMHSNFEDNAEVRAVVGVRCEYDIFNFWGNDEKAAKQEIKQQLKTADEIKKQHDSTTE